MKTFFLQLFFGSEWHYRLTQILQQQQTGSLKLLRFQLQQHPNSLSPISTSCKMNGYYLNCKSHKSIQNIKSWLATRRLICRARQLACFSSLKAAFWMLSKNCDISHQWVRREWRALWLRVSEGSWNLFFQTKKWNEIK